MKHRDGLVKTVFILLMLVGFSVANVFGQGNPSRVVDLKTRAERGDVIAQVELGDSYRLSNSDEAMKWYLKAANRGWADAQYRVADMLIPGYIATPSVSQRAHNKASEAVGWLRRAANQGHARAQERLGDCLHYGQCR